MIRHVPGRRLRAALACSMLLVGAAACSDDVPPPVFEVPGTGSVEGMLFLDADRSGTYDPSAGDRLLTDVGVRLVARGTTQTLAGTETRTNASGRFRITGVPVGTHQLVIDTAGVGAGVSFCQNPVPVTVFLRETLFQQVAARGGCVITIAAAEELPANSPATIRGTVISAPGEIVSGRMYVQDNTGGIRLDNVNLGGATLNVGDIVEISGTRGLDAQEMVITGGVLSEHVPGGSPPAPLPTTTGAIAEAGPVSADPLQGRLVSVTKARVTTAWGVNTGSSRNAFIDDNTGPTTVRIDTGTLFDSARLNEIMGLGKCYNIIGIATSFRGGGQIFPRTLGDITEVPCT